MDKRDSKQIVHLVQDLCPAQKFRENTPEAWEIMFKPLRCTLDEARRAVFKLRETQSFIEPGDIMREIRKARNTTPSPFLVPDADPDDVKGYLRALREGRFVHEPRERPDPGHASPVEVRAAVVKLIEEPTSEWENFMAAKVTLGTVLDQQRWLVQARTELESEGAKLSNENVTIRAAALVEDSKDRS